MALRNTLAAFVDHETRRADQASLGKLEDDGSYTVEAPGKDGYVFFTSGGKDGYGGVVGIARSFQGVAPKLPVFVREESGVAKVMSNNAAKTAAYNPSDNNNFAFSVARHTHGVGSGMTDPVQANRFIPGLVRPFREGGVFGLKVYIEATQYESNNTLTWFAGNSLDLTSFVPGTANKQAWIVCGIDPSSNLPTAKADADYSTATSMNPSQLDGFDFEGNVPLGAVILRNGQTAIDTFKDFADLRVFATSNSTAKTPNVVVITANYTVTASDDVILVDASGGDVTITLQASAAIRSALYIKRKDTTKANTVTISGNGNSIDLQANQTLYTMESMRLQSDGSDWWIL
ncbi:MAG: hypothetical protein ACYTEQ_06465 [Planctomycetota bacterium]|jgi:hypothetical protein